MWFPALHGVYVLCMCAVPDVHWRCICMQVTGRTFKAVTQHLAMCAPVPEYILSSSAHLPLLQCQAEIFNDDEAVEDFRALDD
jgi:hypothetical protein